jgi:hypothetical protein
MRTTSPVRVSADHRLAYLPAAQGRQSRKFALATGSFGRSCENCAMFSLLLSGGCALPELCSIGTRIYVEVTPVWRPKPCH